MTPPVPSSSIARAGHLACSCPPLQDDLDDCALGGGLVCMSAGFAFAVLSQILANAVLPLAGAFLAPAPSLATLPYAALLVGAAAATFPASLLLDAFGRRAAFASGASLGAAGGLMIAFALAHDQFAALVLGAFWLGVANGFSLFYRHAAAMFAPRRSAVAVAVVFGAGAAAGLVAPSLAAVAEFMASPRPFAGTACLAALAQVCALIAAMLLPARAPSARPSVDASAIHWRTFALATLAAGAAWFAMAALMAAAPLAMVGCGLPASAVVGAVAWHVVAMYAPSLALARLPLAPGWTALGGLFLVAGAAALFRIAKTSPSFSLALVGLGVGWSFATIGATLSIHRDGTPSRWLLAGHDFVLFASAVAGAAAAGEIFA